MSKEEKRKIIIDAAIELFAKKGFHNTKIQDIADNAEVGKGTIYEYFNSKRNLLEESIKYYMTKHKQEIENVIENENNIKDKLIMFAKCHGKSIKNNIDMAHSIAAQSQVISDEMKEWIRNAKINFLKLIMDTVNEGMEKGELRKDLNKEIATLNIIGTISLYYSKRLFFDKDKDGDRDIEVVVETLLKGLINS